jgi:hypothetical protein
MITITNKKTDDQGDLWPFYTSILLIAPGKTSALLLKPSITDGFCDSVQVEPAAVRSK